MNSIAYDALPEPLTLPPRAHVRLTSLFLESGGKWNVKLLETKHGGQT